jgi:hypothetical protein
MLIVLVELTTDLILKWMTEFAENVHKFAVKTFDWVVVKCPRFSIKGLPHFSGVLVTTFYLMVNDIKDRNPVWCVLSWTYAMHFSLEGISSLAFTARKNFLGVMTMNCPWYLAIGL